MRHSNSRQVAGERGALIVTDFDVAAASTAASGGIPTVRPARRRLDRSAREQSAHRLWFAGEIAGPGFAESTIARHETLDDRGGKAVVSGDSRLVGGLEQRHGVLESATRTDQLAVAATTGG